MFSTIASHAKAVFQKTCDVPRALPAAVTAARWPATTHSLTTCSPRMGARSMVSRLLSYAGRSADVPRDWPAPGEACDETAPLGEAGTRARQLALVAPATQGEVQLARETHACRTGKGIPRDLMTSTIRIGMVRALENSTERVLGGDGLGVAAGLRELGVGPGDAVAEQDPNLPSLTVRLAMGSVKAFITMSCPFRARAVTDELKRYREGRTFPLRTVGLDLKPVLPEAHYEQAARKVSRELTVVQGAGLDALPKDIRFKAILARRAFDYMDFHAVDASVREAGRLLQPGDGLVFEFAHAASRPVPASAGVAMRTTGFRDLEDAIRDAGLGLRSLYVTFRLADNLDSLVLPTRRVLPDGDGRISLLKADAAAWSGWEEIAQRGTLEGRPLRIDVSGLLLKEGPAKGRGGVA